MRDKPTPSRTPYPPGRICPVCGSPVGRHDGALFCIPRVGCPRDELTAVEAYLEAFDED